MSRSSQRKGAAAETELAEMLTEILGIPCHRASGRYLPGFTAPDVYAGDWLHIEAKRREQVCLPAALRQAAADARPHQVPIVCHRPNRSPWMATCYLADLARLADAVTRTAAHGIGTVARLPAGTGEDGGGPTDAGIARFRATGAGGAHA